jgi:hypothetical protein
VECRSPALEQFRLSKTRARARTPKRWTRNALSGHLVLRVRPIRHSLPVMGSPPQMTKRRMLCQDRM